MKGFGYIALKTMVLAMLCISFGGLALASEFSAFGPKTYERTPGKPTTVVDTFKVNAKSKDYQLVVTNGGGQSEFDRVSSALILVDGQQIFGPADFNQGVASLTYKLELTHDSEISVELRGFPGAGLQVQVIGHEDSASLATFTRVEADTTPLLGAAKAVPAAFEEDYGVNQQQSDDDTTLINTSFTFPFYGTPRNSFWLGSNGYLTFGQGDTTYSESISQHLYLPRISGYFDDLYPGRSGVERQTYVNELSNPNRVVVTWNEVPEYSNTGANTFQIIVYETGRIQVAYNGMSSIDGIVGLSPGGTPPYQLVDLSNQTATISVSGTTAVLEQFHSGNPMDLDNDFLIFDPNGSSGYDVTSVPGQVSPCIQ